MESSVGQPINRCAPSVLCIENTVFVSSDKDIDTCFENVSLGLSERVPW